MVFQHRILSPIGWVEFRFQSEHLVGLRLCSELSDQKEHDPVPLSDLPDAHQMVIQRVENYFVAPTCLRDLPIQMRVLSPFVQRVMHALIAIPLGETRTYGDIAQLLNTSARAVGMACSRNPIALVIPCHRVVSAKSVGGFYGQTEGSMIAMKEWLLAHEQKT